MNQSSQIKKDKGRSKWRIGSSVALLALVIPFGLSACASDEQSEPSPQPSPSISIPVGVDPVRVVLAIVLLNSGDIDAAISLGQVTPVEVDIAVTAIKEDKVQEWLDLASAQVD